MSKSFHTRHKDLKGKTKKEIDEMVNDPDSLLNELVKKRIVKRETKTHRKINKMLDVKHYLNIYTIRKNMQDKGLTNPSPRIKQLTKEFVEKLSKLPLNEEVKLENNSFFDSKGNLITKIPIDEEH